MAKYTIQLKTILEGLNNNTSSVGYDKIDELIKNTMNKIVIGNFGLSEEIAQGLKYKIISNYLFQEIAHDTPAMFLQRLNNKLNLIMPKYKIMYDNVILDYGLNGDFNLEKILEDKTENEGKGKTSSKDEIKGDNESKTEAERKHEIKETAEDTDTTFNAKFDGGQASLKMLEVENYLTSGDKSDNKTKVDHKTEDFSTDKNTVKVDSKTNSTGEISNEQKSIMKKNIIERTVGFTGNRTRSEMFSNMVKNLINIDEQIIYELRYMFFCIL